jgi:hypothetical protein
LVDLFAYYAGSGYRADALGEHAYYTRREWSEAQGHSDIGVKICDMKYDSLGMVTTVWDVYWDSAGRT